MNTDQSNQAALEAQAKKVSQLLDTHAKGLSMRTLKQLEDARARAVKIHAEQSSGVINADGSASMVRTWVGHHRLVTSSLVIAIFFSAFVGFKMSVPRESSDAYLLSADLPPEAFVDRGFAPALNKQKKYI